jgi:CHAT domain-containing protein
VTLSACETGLGRAAGGDLVGLCRGFLAAGARTLVVSLWRVDDAATAELMAAFYRQLTAGQSPAAALRAAQLAGLARYGHPYYWAPWVVVGNV